VQRLPGPAGIVAAAEKARQDAKVLRERKMERKAKEIALAEKQRISETDKEEVSEEQQNGIDIWELLEVRGNMIRLPDGVYGANILLSNDNCAAAAILHSLNLDREVTTPDAQALRLEAGMAASGGKIGKLLQQRIGEGVFWKEEVTGRVVSHQITWDWGLSPLRREAVHRNEMLEKTQLELLAEHLQVRLQIIVHDNAGGFFPYVIEHGVRHGARTINLLFDERSLLGS
jgi:hypothetical protein